MTTSGSAASTGSTGTGPSGIPTSAYIAKYNRFVDTIMDRVNKILRRSYDPVNVRLQPPQQKNTASGPKKADKKKKKTQQRQQSGLVLPETSEMTSTNGTFGNVTGSVTTNRTKRAKKANKKGGKKPQTRPAHTRAKATLYGLSSIKRSGDVTVNMMSTHTTVKTNFLVGPLTLKVEKEFGRGAKKELRSATATTAEMSGRLNLRVVHGGAATLHSIKVMQPKQVRMDAAHGVPSSSPQVQVDSLDDHDRTREFLWSRSSHIARLVSQKLTSATKSMLRPPPSASESKEVVSLTATQSTTLQPNVTTPTITPVVATAA